VDASKNSKTRAVDCAPCTDSDFTLKEQTLMLNNMELVHIDESEITLTDDEELLA
jgi:hypothetical protein